MRHTSCSLLIQENADPDVRRDLEAFFRRLVPPADDPSMDYLVHRLEGPDDMPAHIKSALTQVSLSIPVTGGGLALGTWQGIYLFEHRDRPHRREVVMHLSPRLGLAIPPVFLAPVLPFALKPASEETRAMKTCRS